MKLSDFLTAERLTSAEFAEQIGVSHKAVANWRRGARMPRPQVLTRIAAATRGQVTANDFLPPPEIVRPGLPAAAE
jgi:transcriptional regulator with XRE-family HTH domain